MQTIKQQFSVQYAFPVISGRDVFRAEDTLLASVFLQGGKRQHKVLCFVDSGVLAAHPSLPGQIRDYANVHYEVMQLCGTVVAVDGGESCKNGTDAVDMIMEFIKENRLCRHSFILAVGGGAVLDAVGYGAAIAHRGLRLIRYADHGARAE